MDGALDRLGQVFDSREEALRYGIGGIWFEWGATIELGLAEPPKLVFPIDVCAIGIVLPVTWAEIDAVYRDKNVSSYNEDNLADVLFWTGHPKNQRQFSRYSLSGTAERPTLSPRIELGAWCGFLSDGRLKSQQMSVDSIIKKP